ncbi:phage tail tube protein [Pseudomonas syringae]|uniref:phage tail tube protein n=1 Tax=Pseudomonas syringae TaxID=317 RepID=UPI00041FA9E4|nr:phage tail tube protein [Pseudomonas syringae]
MSIKTQGTDLYAIDPLLGTLIFVSCVTSIDGIDSAIDQIETTCLNDQAREYESGLATPGTATFGINTDPSDPVHVRMHQLKTQGLKLDWVIGWSDGRVNGVGIPPTVEKVGNVSSFELPPTRTWLTFRGHMSSYPFSFAQNDVVKSSIGVQISGEPVLIAKVPAQ